MWVTGQYNSYSINLGGFYGRVMWESSETGFKGSFENWTLKPRFKSLDEAKAAVERLAIRKAEELLAAVNTLRK